MEGGAIDSALTGLLPLQEWSEQPVTPEMEAALTSERWGRHRWLQANGLRFHVVEKGRPRDEQGRRRPLVLFLHGFPEFWCVREGGREGQADWLWAGRLGCGCCGVCAFWTDWRNDLVVSSSLFRYSWRHQLEALGGEYYCVAMDLRGYGQSDKPAAREDYAVEVLVADVRAVIRALGYDKAVRRRQRQGAGERGGEAILVSVTTRMSWSVSATDPPTGPLPVWLAGCRCWWVTTGAARSRGTWRTRSHRCCRRWW